MLSDAPVGPALPASDFDRAKAFYQETLGLTVVTDEPGNVMFSAGEGTVLLVYASDFAGTNKATAAAFRVEDLAAVMGWLRGRGVRFEEYDLPGLKTVDGVVTFGSSKAAFFTDSEGNILSLAQLG